jgi:hypothetical protein
MRGPATAQLIGDAPRGREERRRACCAASNTLSHRHFTEPEIPEDMSRDVYGAAPVRT